MKKLFTLIGCAAGMLPGLLNAQTNSVMLKANGSSVGMFNNIQTAYNSIPGVISQPYEIELQDTYTGANETLPVTLTNRTGASAVNTITITNTGNVPLSISCNLATTDAFVLDNAHWVTINSKSMGSAIYPTFSISGTGATQSHYMVVIKNGASNNTISNIELYGRPIGTGSTVYIATGGNTDNTIEHNYIQGPIGITSSGTINDPNTGLIIRRNLISSTSKAGILLNQGAGEVHIDSNTIAHFGIAPSTEGYGILHQMANDSIFITRNFIMFSTQKLGAITRGINLIAAGPLGPGGAYTLLANNMILGEQGGIQVMGDTMYHTSDSMSNLIGVEFLGAGIMLSDVINNTIRLTGNMDGVPATNAYSAVFQNANNNPGSLIRVLNNIFVNERNTGSAASENIGLSYATTSNIIMADYNTYNSATGILAKIAGTNYATLATLRTALGGTNESQANLFPVIFFDEYDLHLNRTVIGNPNLMGMPVGGIIRDDIDGQNRGSFMRGADEYDPLCLGVSTNSSISPSAPAAICMNDYVNLSASINVPAMNGVIYQWQSRPAGSSVPFSNVSGTAGNKSRLIVKPTGSMEYRFLDSCLRSGIVGVSDTVSVTVNPIPDLTAINEAHFGMDYEFTPSGNVANINPLTYHWDFGDGTTTGTDSPSHTYTTEGEYEVELYVVGLCGSDTVRMTVNATLGVNDVKTGKLSVYPNPATGRFILEANNLPVGEQVYITITSMMGANVYRQSFRNSSSKLMRDVDMSGYTPGVYNVELRSGTVVYRGNIVLQ